MHHTSKMHPEVLKRGRECTYKRRWRAVVYGSADNVAGLAAQATTVFEKIGDIQVVRDPIQKHLYRWADRVPIDGRGDNDLVEIQYSAHQGLEVVTSGSVFVVIRCHAQLTEIDDVDVQLGSDVVHELTRVAVSTRAPEQGNYASHGLLFDQPAPPQGVGFIELSAPRCHCRATSHTSNGPTQESQMNA